MRKDDLLAFLANHTDFFDPDNLSETFTASYLARHFNLSRNTVSHYLNQLVGQDVLIKINTRPVYFLHKQAFCQQFFPLTGNEYVGVAELLAEGEGVSSPQSDHFSLLTGHDGSLRKAVEQLKTALFYPCGGLPVLITGDSGTGKSYMAQLMHEFAIARGLLAADAPFISFNCAQYASNPELLTANLFGYVKGAFTGAHQDKKGAFEAADGGILFLDEVHRLNAEGQEKLFTWFDRKEIYRVGETAHGRPVAVRLVFATTGEIHTTFLTTFIRRIPVVVSLPDLHSRSRHEKEALTLQFFCQEAKTLATRLRLTPRLLQVLHLCVWRGNVGELKNVIKYSVASAWAKNPASATLTVTLHDLPQHVMAALPALSEPMAQEEALVVDAQSDLACLLHTRDPGRGQIVDIQHRLLALYETVLSGKASEEDVQKSMAAEIETLFDRLIFDHQDSNSSPMLLLTTNQLREEFYRLEKRFNIQFNGNCIYALSHYLVRRAASQSKLSSEKTRLLDDFLARKHPLLYRFCQEILTALTRKLDIEPQRIDVLLLVLWLHKYGACRQQQVTRAVLLAHGYATASSIASVANRLLKSQLFESFDMPLDVTPEAIACQVMSYIESNALASGLVILVDMGSLNAIHQHFNRRLPIPVAIINNVSTSMALYVGERILQGHMLEDIVQGVVLDLPVQHQLYYPHSGKPRVILTTCATGIGAATNLSTLLKASIPEALATDILACDYDSLADNKRREPVFNRYEVLAIVGTLDTHIADIPWISLDSLISGEGNQQLMRIFGNIATVEQVNEINNLILKNFSLRRVIESVTILDTSKVINQVEQFLLRYEHLAGCDVANDRKVALYVHISCLIERLIRNAPLTNYARRHCPESELAVLREAFSVIESGYSVKIPLAELCYIQDILTQETEFSKEDQEF